MTWFTSAPVPNLELSLQTLPLYTLEDFDVTPITYQRLSFNHHVLFGSL